MILNLIRHHDFQAPIILCFHPLSHCGLLQIILKRERCELWAKLFLILLEQYFTVHSLFSCFPECATMVSFFKWMRESYIS